jgi:deazaflavin-dependent oxidoreductase (nitroreductase family)
MARPGGAQFRAIADRGWIAIWGTVQHVGRKSGKGYRTPVAVLSSGQLLMVPLPFGGATQWVRNVLDAGGCVIRWRGRDTEVTEPRVADWSEVKPLVPRILRPIIGLTGVRHFLVAHVKNPRR